LLTEPIARAVHLVQTQTDQRGTLFGGATDRGTDLFYNNCLLSHGLGLLSGRSSSRRVLGAQDVRHFLAATLRDGTWRLLFLQPVHGGADHVVGVLRTDGLGHNVLNAQHFENGAHGTTGDDTSTFWCGAHDHFACAPTAIHVVVQRAAFAQLNADHLAFGLLGRLADRLGHLLGFTFAKADTALLIAYNHEGCETKALTAFYSFGHAVDGDQTVGKFRCFARIIEKTLPFSAK